MQHEFHKELSSVVEALQKAFDTAEQLPPLMSAFKYRVQNVCRLEMNVLNAQIGNPMRVTEQAEAGPITHIMGELVNRPQPVTIDAITPTNMERDKFIADRDNLYEKFLSLDNGKIYARAKMPGGEPVVRAVAKKAGIENYADAKINDLFLNAIRTAIKAENELNASLNEAEEKLKTV